MNLLAAPTWRRAVVAAVLAPACATLLALPLRSTGILTAGSIYALAVVSASVVGGAWAGVGASVLSFLGLNFFFTEPTHTLIVGSTQDAAALLVFLVVSLTIGTLVTRVASQREEEIRREKERALVNSMSADLLSGEPIEQVLTELTRSLMEPSRLAWVKVEIPSENGEQSVSIVVGSPGGKGPTVTVPVGSSGGVDGSLEAGRRIGDAEFGRRDLDLLQDVGRQITLALERARLGASVQLAQLEAQESQVRVALFSSVTHDLRTPLASIKAAVTSLLQEDVTYDAEQQRDLLTTVVEESDRLDRLIGNILDLAKARAGALEPSREPTHVGDLIDEVISRLRPLGEGINIRVLTRQDLPLIMVDPVQLDQALTNVLENAIRFSPRGSEILVATSNWQGNVHIRIADQGRGVPESDRERVFEPFVRDAKTGGSGLGLPIAKAIVELHDGRIWIEGAPGGGAAMIIELPAAGAGR